jgi:hypothetical protein
MRKTQKTTAVVGGTIAAVLVGGVAFAYWTTSGSGSGTGATTAGVSNHVGFAQYALSDMYPGDSAQPLKVTVSNDSGESAYIAHVKAYITTDKSGCTGADFKLGGSAAPSTEATATDLTWTATDLAAHASADATSTIQFNNTGANQDACKTAAVTIHYVAS